MNFAFNEEQEELRKTVRQFLEAKSPETAVREQMDTEAGYDAAVWQQMGEQLGLQGLVIPEEFGGSGYGYIELVVILEEMGRALLCAPFFSSVVLAANTLLHSGDDAAKADYLPGIASGETIATLAFTEENGRWDEEGVTATATQAGDAWTIDGTKMYVLDGHTASLLLVAARSGKGVSLFAVDADAAALSWRGGTAPGRPTGDATVGAGVDASRGGRARGTGSGKVGCAGDGVGSLTNAR